MVQEAVGGTEIEQRKKKIQELSDLTSASLKKHVYANYAQFIETAKEISRKLIFLDIENLTYNIIFRLRVRDVSTFSHSF